MATIPLLEYVISELESRKGEWPSIAKEMQPETWESYYSWLQKVGQRRIPDPGVNKIEALANHLRSLKRRRVAV